MPPCQAANAGADHEVLRGDAKLSTTNATKENADSQKVPQKTPEEYDPVLKGLYILTCYLCFAMVAWIMVAPASWLYSRSRFHREVLIPYMKVFVTLVPASVVTKYQDHDLVHFTHFVPAALWAAIIPFQLHPTWRNHHRKLHRRLGYLFLACALLIPVGVLVILHRKLTFENFFPELETNWTHDVQKVALVGMSFWYAYTALQAVQAARSKNFVDHQKWMYRHVASGIFVAVQRLIFFPPFIVYFLLTLGPNVEPSQWAQREIFAAAGELAMVLCIVLGEYAHKRASAVASLQVKKLN